jgi:hypothetical protein
MRSSHILLRRYTTTWYVPSSLFPPFISLEKGIRGTNTMKDGHPGEQEDRRVEHIIPAPAVKEGRYEIYIEVTANGMFGLGPYRYQTPDVRLFFLHLLPLPFL